jgi:hypothetical protein
MKIETPMQELFHRVEQLRFAKNPIDELMKIEIQMLEKEEEMIVRSFMNVSDDRDTRLEDVHLREFAEDYYNKTFKTKER